MELPPRGWLWEIWFLQCSFLGKKTKDLAIGCLQQTTFKAGLFQSNYGCLLLQTCIGSKKTSLWIDTFIPLTLPDPNSLNVNSLSCLVTKKRRGGQREAQTKRDELSGKSLLFRFSFLSFLFFTRVTWLILPVVICLSQRLSHACLSINNFVLWNCEWLIKSVIVYLIIPYYLDNRGNSRANTC